METNILVVDVAGAGWTGGGFVEAAAAEGVLGYPTDARHARFVWHLDVDDAMTDHAAERLSGLLAAGPGA